MLPVLLDLKFIKIYTQGVFLVLALFWSSYFLWKNIRLTSFKEEDIFDGLFNCLFGALFFSRLVYVALHFDKFGLDILKFLLINGYPGLNLVGFIIGGFLSMYVFLLPRKITFSEVVDYVVSPALLAMAIGKIGAFFSGAEIGAKTTFPLAVKYPTYDGLRHLTSFYEGLLFFLGCFIAYKLIFEIRKGKYYKGFTLVFFAWYTSLVYFSLDLLKSYETVFFGKSFNFFISAIILLTLTVYFLYYFRAHVMSKFKR